MAVDRTLFGVLCLVLAAGQAPLGVLAQSGEGTNPLSLCSSENTNSGSGQYFQYNSYGKCTGQCKGYAFAIMQGNECWCSNEVPSSTTDVSECSETCPGFGSDHCGNSLKGLYGYAQIGQPSGTMSASSSQASSTSSSTSSSTLSSTTSSTSSTSTSSSSSTSSTSSSTPSSSSTSSTSSSSSSTPISTSSSSYSSSSSSTSSSSSSLSSSSTLSSSSSSAPSSSTASSTTKTTSPTQLSSTYTTTSSSVSRSDTSSTPASSTTSVPGSSNSVTSFSAGASPNSNSRNTQSGYWHDAGAVGGTFAAVGIVVAALLALLGWLLWRRRRQQRARRTPESDLGMSTPPGSGHGRHAFASLARDPSGANMASSTASSPTSPGHMHTYSGFSDTDLKFVPIFDQRVDPNQMYMRWEHGQSSHSLQDNEDYSRRVLRVANPNPGSDEEE